MQFFSVSGTFSQKRLMGNRFGVNLPLTQVVASWSDWMATKMIPSKNSRLLWLSTWISVYNIALSCDEISAVIFLVLNGIRHLTSLIFHRKRRFSLTYFKLNCAYFLAIEKWEVHRPLHEGYHARVFHLQPDLQLVRRRYDALGV